MRVAFVLEKVLSGLAIEAFLRAVRVALNAVVLNAFDTFFVVFNNIAFRAVTDATAVQKEGPMFAFQAVVI